ncbi:MAG: fumarate hydratase [Sphingomonadaceae bacterium]
MPSVSAEAITEKVRELCIAAAYELPQDVVHSLGRAMEIEESPQGKAIFDELLTNARVASTERIPYCQDTGMVTVFVRKGPGVTIEGGTLTAAINEGVRRGYTEGYLRASVVAEPLFERANTRDNTPAIIHIEESERDELVITVVPKGAGSENMSRVVMLAPSAGWEVIKREVVEAVRKAGANPCPPIVVGVGIGGNFEMCAYLAKKSLVRDVDEPNPDPRIAALERELLEEVNATGIGPAGLGGTVTALAVHIETYPTHIATLPLGINLGCHAYRHKSAVLLGGDRSHG